MEDVEVILWDDDKFIGNICLNCIKMGDQDFSKKLQQQVLQLRDKINIVEDLLDQGISCPSWEDYQKELPAEKRDMQDEQKDPQEIRQITMARMLLIGENVIPKEEVDGLTSEQINIFLKEPDPEKWPPEISHLKKYANMECDIQTFLRPEEP
jgi:hypothetical protein